jgi:hypothetical protein
MPDGTVWLQNGRDRTTGAISTQVYILTPATNGSYSAGTFSTLGTSGQMSL